MADNYWSKEITNFINGIKGETSDGSYVSVPVESVQARAIELGFGWSVTACNDNLTTVSPIEYWLLRTPANGLITSTVSRIHCVDLAVNKNGILKVEYFESPTTTADGTDNNVTIANYNRSSAETADFVVKNAPTVTDDGTAIQHTVVGSFDNVGAGITWQLKPSTDYLLKITNLGDTAILYSIGFLVFQLPL